MRITLFKYGGLAGVILSALILIPFFLVGKDIDYDAGEVFGYSAMVIAMGVGIYFGTQQMRDKHLEGKISFWRAAGTGVLITLIASLIFGIFNYFLYEVADPSFIENFQEGYRQSMIKKGASEAEIQAALGAWENMPDYMRSSFFQAFVMFATVFPIGIVLSFICSAVLRK